MEVFDDHSAAERVQPSIIGHLKTASRFAVLGWLASLGSDRPLPPPSVSHEAAIQISKPSYVRFDDLENQSLIGPPIGVERVDGDAILVQIWRTRDDLLMTVNGKEYRIQKHRLAPHVRMIDAINTITHTPADVEVVSHEYGVANVERPHVQTMLETLSSSNERFVPITIPARFKAREGTMVAMAIALDRWRRGTDGSKEELFEITFERTQIEEHALAMLPPNR